MRPSIGKRAFIPHGLLTADEIRKAQKRLRFQETGGDLISRMKENEELDDPADDEDLETSVNDLGYRGAETVVVNEFKSVPRGISLPRAFAMKNYPHLLWHDATVDSKHKIPFTGSITPRNEQQARFFQSLIEAADQPGPQDILANATTGAGKTVAGIRLAMHLKTPTLIVVDRNKIGDEWLKNMRKFFGQAWVDRNVGRVQSDTIDYRGRAVVIALAQSLSRRRYPQPLYRHFGLLIVDEVQEYGGPFFSPILGMFAARTRLFVTAENRSGSFGTLIKTHTGQTRVVSKQEVMKPNAWVIYNKLEYSFYADNDGAILTNLCRVRERNDKIAGLIHRRGFERGRQVLVLSDRTQQLSYLMKKCADLGIPYDKMGIFAGSYETHRFVAYYRLPGSNKRNRLGVFETRSPANTFIRRIVEDRLGPHDKIPEALYNRLQAGEDIEFETERERFSPTQSDLDNITHSCQIIFATYGIFKKGIDVPRLDMGIEASPSGNVKQPIGRVLRIADNKMTPEWYAIHDFIENSDDRFKTDTNAALLNAFFKAKTEIRFGALKKAHATIKVSKQNA